MVADGGQSVTTWARVAAGCAVALVAATGIVGAAPGSGPVTLTVLATNDLTNQLAAPEDADVGGVAHLASHVRAVRARAPGALHVDAGDLTGSGREAARIFGDEPTIEAMNDLGLDVLAAGNHAFDAGIDHLRRLYDGGCVDSDCAYRHDAPYAGAGFEVLSANVTETTTGEPVLPGWTIREVQGVRVGVVGLTSALPDRLLTPESETTTTPIREVVNPTVERVLDAGAQVVVVVWHEGSHRRNVLGEPDPNGCDDVAGPSWNLREQLHEQVDLVVDGHTHQAYVCDQPERPLMTQALAHGRMFTEATLVYDPATDEVVRRDAVNRWVSHDVAPDPELQALVDHHQALGGIGVPASADLDGDTLGDRYEVMVATTDARAADTDGDGLDDGAEVRVHDTSPTRPDTDRGGVDDGTEVAAGSNPRLGVDDPLVGSASTLGTAQVTPVTPVEPR